MSRLYINPTIQKMIEDYCKLNSITDLNAFANRCALQGLSILKYGENPADNVQREKDGVKDYDKKKIKKEESNVKRIEESHAEGRDESEQKEERVSREAADKEESSEQEKRSKEERSIRRTIKLIRKG